MNTPILLVYFRNRSFLAGIMFVMFGGFGAVFGQQYPIGTPAAMGAGFFPVGVGLLLAILGFCIMLRGILEGTADLGAPKLRPVIVITASILLFGILLREIGLVLSALILISGSRLATTGYRPVEISILAAALTASAVGIFVLGIRLPIPLWIQ